MLNSMAGKSWKFSSQNGFDEGRKKLIRVILLSLYVFSFALDFLLSFIPHAIV